MATKKKTKKKALKPTKRGSKKSTGVKAAKSSTKLAKKKPAPKGAKKQSAKKKASGKEPVQKRSRPSAVAALPRKAPGSRAGEQSGDLQGLPRRESADSESVDELLEEGNAFEAEAVIGVEDADGADEREVHTHEVPEDDVPGEYLDKD